MRAALSGAIVLVPCSAFDSPGLNEYEDQTAEVKFTKWEFHSNQADQLNK